MLCIIYTKSNKESFFGLGEEFTNVFMLLLINFKWLVKHLEGIFQLAMHLYFQMKMGVAVLGVISGNIAGCANGCQRRQGTYPKWAIITETG